MPSDSGQGTESYTWDTETEWNNGAFTDTDTDGSGNLELADIASPQSFDWEIDVSQSSGASGDSTGRVTITDTSSGTTLANEQFDASGESIIQSGTFSIDVSTHEDLSFEAFVDTDDAPTGQQLARISGPIDGSNVTIVEATLADGESNSTASDTQDEIYEFVMSGSWVSDDYTFSEVTTATKLSWGGVTLPNAGDDISVTVEDSGGSNTHTESLTAGSGSALVEIAASDTYRLDVAITTASDDTTPTVGSLSLETHTPPSGLSITDTRNTEVDFSWSGVSVSDGYEIYYAPSSGVTDSDTLGFDTTNSGTTTGTVTGLDQGTTYHFNVRAQYSGE